MQSLSHISVGIPIQALSQMSSFTIMFLKCNLSHQSHDCYSRKLSLHHCMLNTAVSFFHSLDKYSPVKRLVPVGHHPIHTAVLSQPSSSSSLISQASHGWTSPARRFPAGLHVSSSCGLPKHLRSFTSHHLKEIPVDIRLLGFFVLSLRHFSSMMDTKHTDMLLAC